MTKILITGVNNSLNNGCMAMAISTEKALKSYMPDIKFDLISTNLKIDRERFEKHNIKVVDQFWYKETNSRLCTLFYSGLYASLFLFNCILWRVFNILHIQIPIKGGLKQYDAVIDLGGDTLGDYYGTISLCYHLYPFLLANLIKKPFIIYAQSIGPFKRKINRILARFILNNASMITLRDKISIDYLQEAGISKPPLYITADSAFLLEPVDISKISEIFKNENVDYSKPLVGISASQGIYHHAFPNINIEEKYEKYVIFMAEITDFMIEKMNATILFIPHVIRHDDDDRIVQKNIYQKIKNRNKVKLIEGEYTADELKKIISICDIFIGCRMHSTVASTSMHVPTIAIAYSHKFYGVIGELLSEDSIIDIRKDFSEVLSESKLKIDHCWKNREKISEILRERLIITRKNSLRNAELTAEFLNKL